MVPVMCRLTRRGVLAVPTAKGARGARAPLGGASRHTSLLSRWRLRRRSPLVVINPGGLYGISVGRLGRNWVTSARNARLVAICQHNEAHLHVITWSIVRD
jgi:hypothetical protein